LTFGVHGSIVQASDMTSDRSRTWSSVSGPLLISGRSTGVGHTVRAAPQGDTARRREQL